MSETVSEVAHSARESAHKAHAKIESHEDLCAERYKALHKDVGRIWGTLKWAGGIVTTIVVSLIGFLAVQQFNANSLARDRADRAIEAQQRESAEQKALIQALIAAAGKPEIVTHGR